METTVIFICLAVFCFFMILSHKLRFVLTGSSPVEVKPVSLDTIKQDQLQTAQQPRSPILKQQQDSFEEYASDGTLSPTSSYRITIAEDETRSASEVERVSSPVTRTERVISYIRFSGFPRSDVSESDWSSLSSMSSRSSSLEDTMDDDQDQADQPKIVNYRRTTIFPQSPETDTVEIECMPGFAEKNLLEFKPHNPRALTTKHIKKHAVLRTPFFIV